MPKSPDPTKDAEFQNVVRHFLKNAAQAPRTAQSQAFRELGKAV